MGDILEEPAKSKIISTRVYSDADKMCVNNYGYCLERINRKKKFPITCGK